jgi:hypothetical protein
VFGTTIARIANPADFGGNQLRPEYSQLQAWNADGSLLLLNSGFILDTKSYTLAHRVDYRWPGFGHALRWSPVDPRKLYFIGGEIDGCKSAGLYEYNLGAGTPMTGTPKLVKCFAEYQSLFKDQSFEEMSDDGRIIALLGKKPATNKWGYVAEAFAFDVVSGIKHRPMELPVDAEWGPTTGDFVAASPSGKYVLMQFGGGTTRLRGLEAYDLDMNYAGKVNTGSGHGDFTMDSDGTEWAVMTNANNAYLFSGQHYIVKARIPNGVVLDAAGFVDVAATSNAGLTVRLLQLDWFHNVHVSCRNSRSPGWCLISTYSTKSSLDNGWQPFESEIFRVDLTSTHLVPKVDRLAHHRSRVTASTPGDACSKQNDYWSQPHATTRPDGRQVIFGSNWGRICDPSEPVDALVLNVGPVATVVRPDPPKDVTVR